MRYLAWFKGTGGRSNGCDYTIGCNTRVEVLKATTMDSAIEEATKRLEGSGGLEEAAEYWGPKDFKRFREDHLVEEVEVLEISNSASIDPMKMADRLETLAKLRWDKKAEQEEREVLAKLQAKYGEKK